MKHEPSRVVTLATDFGTKDSYVGTMKGVIHSICKGAVIVDLTHQIGHQDLMEASFVLESSYRFFPPGTVHMVVVDPGVGTKRRAIVVDVPDCLFVGPDNGVFSRIYSAHAELEVREIARSEFKLLRTSDTFHGRDVFAPVAAHLANGVRPADLGPIVRDPVRCEPRRPAVWQDQISGEVIYIDSFGNLVTNITREVFDAVTAGRTFRVTTNGKAIESISRSYEDVPRGKALAIFGSMQLLEIAIHGGRADRQMGAGKGDLVQVLAGQGLPD
ncbi:MAG: SAM-dependent chlorinase/fluorinase [Candidatus Eisenbacteria bacterium]|nr:SAM-dependent chlorinase/fluorinase [Candidatus Eisenbacteria bacterium]